MTNTASRRPEQRTGDLRALARALLTSAISCTLLPGSLAAQTLSARVAGYRAAMYYDRPRRLGVVLFRNVGGGKQDYDRLAVDILSSLVTRRANEIQADIDKRFKEQAASPGSEGAVRRLIGELRAGKPNYDLMGSDVARDTRRQILEHQAAIAKLGALRSVTFKGVGPAGPNIYLATFEKGSLEWRVWMNLDGSVAVFRYQEVSPSK